MSPLDVVSDVLERFEPREPREKAFAQALRDLVTRQAFNATTGKISGPRLNIEAIARHAELPRGLISHEGCELQRVRELVIDALRLLSDFSLRVECDYLKEENKRLQARLDRYDSGAANRVVSLFREQAKEGEKPKKRATAKDVRKAVIVLPMSKL
jgi:hypothetical protein